MKTLACAAIALSLLTVEGQAQSIKVPPFLCTGFSPSECNKRQNEYQAHAVEIAKNLLQSERQRASTDCLEREAYIISELTDKMAADKNTPNSAWEARDIQIRDLWDRCDMEDTLKVNLDRADRMVQSHIREMGFAWSKEALTETMNGIANRIKEQNSRRFRAQIGRYTKSATHEWDKRMCRELLAQ